MYISLLKKKVGSPPFACTNAPPSLLLCSAKETKRRLRPKGRVLPHLMVSVFPSFGGVGGIKRVMPVPQRFHSPSLTAVLSLRSPAHWGIVTILWRRKPGSRSIWRTHLPFLPGEQSVRQEIFTSRLWDLFVIPEVSFPVLYRCWI